MRENDHKKLNPPPQAGFGHIEGAKGNISKCSFPSRGRLGWGAAKAFTLAEVLITLVVIGIVAAITIPMISRSSEKYILKNQFKKTYSTMLNAVNKADTDLGGNTQCYYGAGGLTGAYGECTVFLQQMMNNLNVQKFCNGNAKRDGCIPTPYREVYDEQQGMNGLFREAVENTNPVYNLADGTIIIMYGRSGNMPLFQVDINGAKGPNECRKDVYRIRLEKSPDTGIYFSNDIYCPTNKTGYYTELSQILN